MTNKRVSTLRARFEAIAKTFSPIKSLKKDTNKNVTKTEKSTKPKKINKIATAIFSPMKKCRKINVKDEDRNNNCNDNKLNVQHVALSVSPKISNLKKIFESNDTIGRRSQTSCCKNNNPVIKRMRRTTLTPNLIEIFSPRHFKKNNSTTPIKCSAKIITLEEYDLITTEHVYQQQCRDMNVNDFDQLDTQIDGDVEEEFEKLFKYYFKDN